MIDRRLDQDPLTAATAWLAACAEACTAIGADEADAIKAGVALVFEPPWWAGITPELSLAFRRGRQMIWDAMTAQQQRMRLGVARRDVEQQREDGVAVIKRAAKFLIPPRRAS